MCVYIYTHTHIIKIIQPLLGAWGGDSIQPKALTLIPKLLIGKSTSGRGLEVVGSGAYGSLLPLKLAV